MTHTDPHHQLERHNYRQIEALNQRGGRTLSIVDLIQARTLSVQMAAAAAQAIEQGASLLTGAVPGGAGKTTLMAALLGFLPPGVAIHTVDRPGVLAAAGARPADEPACYLVHEIGSGSYYGYLWGPPVADYLGLVAGRRRIASCLHADTLDQLQAILCAPPLNVPPEALARVDLVLFMAIARGARGYRRRVSAFWQTDATGRHRLRFRWDPADDSFEAVEPQPAGEADPGIEPRPAVEPRAEYVSLIEGLVASGEADYRAVRRGVLEFYDRRRS